MDTEVNPDNREDLFLIKIQDLESLIEERYEKKKERYLNIKQFINHFFELLNTQTTTGGNHHFFLDQIENEIGNLENDTLEMEAINDDIMSYVKETNNRAIYFSDIAKSHEMMLDVSNKEKEMYMAEIAYLNDLSNEKDNIIEELKNEILIMSMPHNNKLNESINQSYLSTNDNKNMLQFDRIASHEPYNTNEDGNGIINSQSNNNAEAIARVLEENNAFKCLNYNLEKENGLFKKQINMLEQKHAALKLKLNRISQNAKIDDQQRKKIDLKAKNSMFLPTLNSKLSIILGCKLEKYERISSIATDLDNRVIDECKRFKGGYKSKKRIHRFSKVKRVKFARVSDGHRKSENLNNKFGFNALENGYTSHQVYCLQQIVYEQTFSYNSNPKKFCGKSYPINAISLEIKDNTVNHIYDFMNTIKQKYFTTPVGSAQEVHLLYNKYFKKKRAESNVGPTTKHENLGYTSARQKASNCNYFESN